MNPKLRDLLITAGLLAFIGLIVLFCTGCNSDYSLPNTNTDLVVVTNLDMTTDHPLDSGHDLLSEPAIDLSTTQTDLTESRDMTELNDLTPAVDLTSPPDLVTQDLLDPCAAHFTVTSLLPADRLFVVSTANAVIGQIEVTTTSGDFTTTEVFIEFSTSTGLVPGDFQNLKLMVKGQTVSQVVPMCKQNGKSISCSFVLIQPILVKGGMITFDVAGDIGGPGQARLGDTFTLYAGPTAVRLEYQGNAVDFYCISAVGANDENTIVPFLVNVAGEWPAVGTSTTLAIIKGSPIGRFKIKNLGNALITIIDHYVTDRGARTGNTTKFWLDYSDQNSNNYQGNTAIASSGDMNFTDLPKNGKSFTIDGGAYRYTTVGIADPGMLAYMDVFVLQIAHRYDIRYVATEADLGYDANLDGQKAGNTVPLPTSGFFPFPIQLGILIKQ